MPILTHNALTAGFCSTNLGIHDIFKKELQFVKHHRILSKDSSSVIESRIGFVEHHWPLKLTSIQETFGSQDGGENDQDTILSFLCLLY